MVLILMPVSSPKCTSLHENIIIATKKAFETSK
jgi:hypothetical protein